MILLLILNDGIKQGIDVGSPLMRLWLLEVGFSNRDYDIFTSCVVVAESKDEARLIHPSGDNDDFTESRSWVSLDEVVLIHVTYLGEADNKYTKPCVICSSYRKG